MQGTYWLTVLPETSQLRPRIKRALRGIDDDVRVSPTVDDRKAEVSGRRFGGKFRKGFDTSGAATPRVDDRQAESSGRSFGEKFRRGFERSGASRIEATARLMGAGFQFASSQAGNVVRHVGLAATAIGIAARITKGFARSLLVASTGLRYVAGVSLSKIGVGLGVAAKLAGRLATQVSRVTAAVLVLASVGKLLSFMNRAAKLMSLLTIGGAALLGVTSALASSLGAGLVAALTAVGSSAGVAAGALVGLLGPAIAVAKIGFKGLGEGAKAFAETMKDAWGPADEAFNQMIGQRMGPLLTQFRELKMGVTDAFSGALIPAFGTLTGLMAGLQPRFTQLADTLGGIGSKVTGALASPETAGALDKMFAASNQFVGSLGPGISNAVSGLVQFAATAADTFKGAGVGISDLLAKFGDWLRGISPLQMVGAFAALRQMVTNVWNVLKPVLTGIRDIGAVSAPALAPGVKAIGDAIGQAAPGLVRMTEILMPALSQVMERLAPVLPELVRAFTPWAGVLSTIAPPLATIVADLAPLAPLLLVTVGAVKAIGAGMAIYHTAMLVAANVTKVWTAAQWLFNAAMTANPIGLIVAAVAALAAGIIYAYNHSETFRKIVQAAWEGIKTAALAVVSWFTDTAWPALQTAWEAIGAGWNWLVTTAQDVGNGIRDKFNQVVDFFKGLPGAISRAASGMWDGLKTGLVEALRWIANKWNTLSSALSFTVPPWVPVVGGKTWQLPQIPGFAGGSAGVSASGVFSGPGTGTSDSILAMVSNGEGIVKSSAMASGGAVLVAALNAGWVPSADYLRAMLPGFAAGRGPDVSVAEGMAGTGYDQTTRFDCSGTVARVINGALGVDGGLMSTKTARSWLAARGFVDGSGGPGTIRVGWYDHGPNPNDGHMAMTLSDGRNAESGGSNGVFTIGAGAAGAGDSQFDNHMYLPQMFGEGAGSSSSLGAAASAGGGGSYRAATGKELTASAGRVSSSNEAVRQAGQSVDDRTYSRDKAQRRVDQLKAEGKDTTDAQHSLDVANRELADANGRLADKRDKAAKAEQDDADLRSNGVLDPSAAKNQAASSSTGGGFGDLGKSLAGGILETFGLDGSLFSNPFEWPTVKSAMAGVNFLGSLFSGGDSSGGPGGAASASGQGGLGGLLGGLMGATGLTDAITTGLNPGGSNIAAPHIGSNAAPGPGNAGTGGGGDPYNGPPVVIQNAGMSPTDVSNKLSADFNARTRTTKVH